MKWYEKLAKWFRSLFGSKPEPTPTPDPVPVPSPAGRFDHLIGIGMFIGLYPWRDNRGIYNDAPKDIKTLIQQWAKAGGNLIQVQLLYIEGAVFGTRTGMRLDAGKVRDCQDFRDTCKENGVNVTFVLFDYCTLKKESKWALSPLNAVNGGPFAGALDLYSNFPAVKQYVTEIVRMLDGDNVIWEIVNEGSKYEDFAKAVHAHLKSLGVTRITSSGPNIPGLWRFSPHGCTKASDVKAGSLPNTDGKAWDMEDVAAICEAVRETSGSGFVFDGATDSGHDWQELLRLLK